jgi:enoyl-CoA hydratase/carnithine racemase
MKEQQMDIQDSPVLFELIGAHVAVVTLNRPAQRNAVNGALARALEAAVDEIESNPAIRAAVLYSSSDRAFCAGADLSEISAGRAHELMTKKGGFAGFAYRARTKPFIAAVRGFALGGGLELSLACEMIVAGESSVFGLPEVKRGIMAAAGGAYRLPRAIPRAIAFEMITTGTPIPAARAFDLGLVNRVVPDDEVRAQAIALAEGIAANAPLAVRESLAIAKIAAENTDLAMQGMLNDVSNHVMKSPDAQEGPRAFVEKRAPVWQG